MTCYNFLLHFVTFAYHILQALKKIKMKKILTTATRDLAEQNSMLEKKVKDLEHQLDTAVLEKTQPLIEENAKLLNIIKQLQSEKSTALDYNMLSEQHEKLKASFSAVQEQNVEVVNDNKMLRAKVVKIEGDLHTRTEMIRTQLQPENQMLQDKLNDLQSENAMLNSKVIELSTSVQHDTDIADLTMRNSTLRKQVSDLEEKLAKLEVDNKKLVLLTSENKILQSKVEQLEVALKNSDAADSLSTQNKELLDKVQHLQKQNANLQASVKVVDTLTTENKSLQVEVAALKKSITAKPDSDRLQQTVQQLEQVNRQLLNEKRDLSFKCDELQTTVEMMGSKIADADNTMSDNKFLNQKCQSMSEDLQFKNNEIKMFTEQLKVNIHIPFFTFFYIAFA